MEGPASEAYASSLRVESGQEKSVYDQSNQSSEEENIDDPNAEINAATNEDEYVDALRKNITAVYLLERFKLSMQLNKAIMKVMIFEKVYQTIQQREQDIANGKYDKYKNN